MRRLKVIWKVKNWWACNRGWLRLEHLSTEVMGSITWRNRIVRIVTVDTKSMTTALSLFQAQWLEKPIANFNLFYWETANKKYTVLLGTKWNYSKPSSSTADPLSPLATPRHSYSSSKSPTNYKMLRSQNNRQLISIIISTKLCRRKLQGSEVIALNNQIARLYSKNNKYLAQNILCTTAQHPYIVILSHMTLRGRSCESTSESRAYAKSVTR